MVTIPSLREMLESGAHFGHKTSRWHPKMKKFIFMGKNGVHVINLEKTQEELEKAVSFVKSLAEENKTVIFVGSKKQASMIIKKAAETCSMPYVNFRWIGGTLTNFETVKAAIASFKKKRADLENESSSQLSKKAYAKLRDQVEKGEKLFGGLVHLEKKPDALILLGLHDEKNALAEARKEGIPVIAIVDTNADPTLATYPIPANDDATKSIELFANVLAQTIKENKKSVVKEN